MRLIADDVDDSKVFAEYVRQELGVPRPLSREWGRLNKELKGFWAKHPHATWGTLTRGVAALKNRRCRPPESTAWVVYVLDVMVESGRLGVDSTPEIDPEVLAAVQAETDRSWQLKLLGATGKSRDIILEDWRNEREPHLG